MTMQFRMRALAGAALAAGLTLATAARAQDHQEMDQMDSGHMDHAGMDHPMPEMMSGHAMDHHMAAMPGVFGPYAMTREGSGTSWTPEATPMNGIHAMTGGWMVMTHASLTAAYTDQGGLRGGEKAYLGGMVGIMAHRDLGPGTLGLRGMFSPDPFMGKSGYPLLLGVGETADGETTLVDRQHPHDLFMELSASYSLPVGETGSVFVYGGLPGEPAFGPPAFMHRLSGQDLPEAPITHHWLDSTHVTFGVVTAGFTWDRWKIDASRFRGREPDEKRFDIETGALDSTSVRVTFNPDARWSLQTSWASIESPEALEPHHDERRVSLSAMYARPVGADGLFAATAAWARKDKVPGDALQAALIEASYRPNADWTLFGRAEQAEQDELGGEDHGPAYTVRKLSLGVVRDFRLAEHVKAGIGGQVSAFGIEEPLGAAYGDPAGATVFVRFRLD